MVISDEICEIDLEKAKKQFEEYEKFIYDLKRIIEHFNMDGAGLQFKKIGGKKNVR